MLIKIEKGKKKDTGSYRIRKGVKERDFFFEVRM